MREFPDANSGGLDPHAGGLDGQTGGLDPLAPRPKAPLAKRVRAWAILLLLCAAFVGMAIGGGFELRSAFKPGRALDDRLYTLAVAAALFAPMGLVLWTWVRSRWKTGRWLAPRKVSAQKFSRCSAEGVRAGRAAQRVTFTRYAIAWASYAAFAPECSPGQRAAAWGVLGVYALALLGMTAFGVICFGAAFDNTNTLTATLMFLGLGAAILLWPAVVVWKLVRGKRAGKLGATREELDAMRAQRTAWATRESQKPLRSKIVGTAITMVFYALWWMRVTIHHAQHPRESWVEPAMAMPFFLYSIWAQFRRPKTAAAPIADH